MKTWPERQPNGRDCGQRPRPLPPFAPPEQQRYQQPNQQQQYQQPPPGYGTQQQYGYSNPQPVYPDVPPPAGTERVWTVHDRGQQFGPHTELEIASLVAVGTISLTAMVWRTGSSRWVPVTSIVPMPAYPPPVSQPYHPGNRQIAPGGANNGNRVGVGIVAILLGGLGIHKFMLGFTTPGLIMLGITVCTCGYGGIIVGIIGVAEGVTYLTKTDQQFHHDYVVNKKQWF